MTLIQARQLFTPRGIIASGWVEVTGGRIRAWGERCPAIPDMFIDALVSPGFVDVHCHGGGGAGFGADPEEARTVVASHLAHGTTTVVASLVTAVIDDLERQVRTLAGLVADGRLAGIHLEGPWLSAGHRGAHPADRLADPTITDIDRLLEAGAGGIRMVTIAPELPGGLAAIDHLTRAGVVAAIGHTGADYDTTRAAIDTGARGATHLFNAMPPLLHRAPGPVLALWRDPRVWVELIADAVHIHPDLLAAVMATKPAKSVLVTDAMAAAAHADGDYDLGELRAEVRDGIAHVAGTTTIAGSTLTLDQAVRTAVTAGVPVETALRAATANPAEYLNLPDVGRITQGAHANLIALDDTLTVTRVMHRGRWV